MVMGQLGVVPARGIGTIHTFLGVGAIPIVNSVIYVGSRQLGPLATVLFLYVIVMLRIGTDGLRKTNGYSVRGLSKKSGRWFMPILSKLS
jgi:hypothetical protein